MDHSACVTKDTRVLDWPATVRECKGEISVIGVPIGQILSGGLESVIVRKVSHSPTRSASPTKALVTTQKVTVVLAHFSTPNKEDAYRVQMVA